MRHHAPGLTAPPRRGWQRSVAGQRRDLEMERPNALPRAQGSTGATPIDQHRRAGRGRRLDATRVRRPRLEKCRGHRRPPMGIRFPRAASRCSVKRRSLRDARPAGAARHSDGRPEVQLHNGASRPGLHRAGTRSGRGQRAFPGLRRDQIHRSRRSPDIHQQRHARLLSAARSPSSPAARRSTASGWSSGFTPSTWRAVSSRNDETLNKLWALCARSCQVFSEDAYVDCADRERTEWMDDDPPAFDITRTAMAGPEPAASKVYSDRAPAR